VKSVRVGAWVVLLALAGAQAWSARFYPSPDGISYLDLSDAVLSGQWRELLNAYWSPLYPALVGLVRAVARPTPYWEFGVVHLLNLLLFALSLAGFEYLLTVMREVGRTHWGKPGLSTTWGTAGAYAIFGALTLMMTPLTLPTPDLLVSAASFFVFGALLRLRDDIEARRAAIVLGVALAVGSLTKSFVIPWAGICIITATVAVRGRSIRPVVIAAGIWLVAVVPWTIGLSAKYGHLTFGDTGRLTYVWYVNRVETPSAKLMPHAAATAATDSILPGVAITPNAAGTNPVWYDPARWYGDLHPRFDLKRQVLVLGILVAEYISSLAPVFLLMAFWLIAAGRSGTAEWFRRTWPVVVPALAALIAYAIVLVTTRYVAPFYMTLALTVICGAQWPERIPPTRMLLAIGVPLILMVATPNPGQPMALINAAVGSVLFVWIARYRSATVQIVLGLVGGAAIRVMQPDADLRYVSLMSVALIVAYWAMARDAEHRGEQPLTSQLTRRTLVSANAVLVLFVGSLKFAGSLSPDQSDPEKRNLNGLAAERATAAGMRPRSGVALVGSPFEAYWARANRMKIVAVVPPPRMGDFNQLSVAQRERLYAEFAKAGALYLVVQQPDPPADGNRMWTPVPYIGWVKALPHQ
jgi:hypothetical protein